MRILIFSAFLFQTFLIVGQNSGKVGIGTDSPQAKLHVNGNIRFDSIITSNAAIPNSLGGSLGYSKVDLRSDSEDNSDLNLSLFFDGGYSPWINTAHARGSQANPTALQENDDILTISGNGYDGDKFLLGSTIKSSVEATPYADHLNTNLTFHVRNNTDEVGDPSEAMRINPAGNVGIGTQNPEAKLHVAGNVAIDGGRLLFPNNNRSIFIGDETGINENPDQDRFNILIGNGAGKSNITGFANVYIGQDAGGSNVEGHSNIAIGEGSLYDNTGNANTSIGKFAMKESGTSRENTAIGNYAGFASMGNNNFYLGTAAGEGAEGNGNVFIGNEVGANKTVNNKLYIANSSTATPLIEGDFESNNLKINGEFTTKKTIAQAVEIDLNSDLEGVDNDASVFIFTSGTNVITLPNATLSIGRTYTIVNKTAIALPIDSYINMTNVASTSIASASSITIISDGTNWQQIN